MNIYLIKNEQNYGPYTESEVKSRIRSGENTVDDLAWTEGCQGGVPLLEILCRPSPATTLPTVECYSAPELGVIAENYRKLLLTAVCWLVACFLRIPVSLESVCLLVIAGYWIRMGWRLTLALRQKPWLWVILSFIPLVNIYALVRVLWKAAKTLKANGIPCGFFGAVQSVVNRLAKQESAQ